MVDLKEEDRLKQHIKDSNMSPKAKKLCLRDHEDAKKFSNRVKFLEGEYDDLLSLYKKDRQIVKRLEAKIKECKENAGGMEFGLALEKILENKDEAVVI